MFKMKIFRLPVGLCFLMFTAGMASAQKAEKSVRGAHTGDHGMPHDAADRKHRGARPAEDACSKQKAVPTAPAARRNGDKIEQERHRKYDEHLP